MSVQQVTVIILLVNYCNDFEVNADNIIRFFVESSKNIEKKKLLDGTNWNYSLHIFLSLTENDRENLLHRSRFSMSTN